MVAELFFQLLDVLGVFSQAALLVPVLLLAAIVFFFLAAALFERYPLERSGQLLVFGETGRVTQVVVPLLLATLVTIAAGNISPFLSTFTLVLLFCGVGLLCAGVVLTHPPFS